MIVAIDGPAGSGKSSTAHELARRHGLTFLDTGAMYRAVTYECLRQDTNIDDEAAVSAVAGHTEIRFQGSGENQRVMANGVDVTREIRTPEVDHAVSKVSAYPQVRSQMVSQQRAIGAAGGVVAEGRDIGTVVFPAAEVKIFLTADAASRARRRIAQRKEHGMGTDGEDEAEVARELARRDELDSNRKESPLRPAEDAHVIDNSTLSMDEVLGLIDGYMEEAEKNAGKTGAKQDSSKPARAPRKTGEAPRMRAFGGNSFDDYYDHTMHEFPLPTRAFMAFAATVVTAATKLLWRWKIEDGRLLWDDRRGRVIIMNHTSMLDPVIVIVSAYFHHQRVRTVFKSEFSKNKLVSWFFSRCGCIPVRRGTADLKVVRRAQAALQKGECVLIFPEGTRIKSDDQPVTIHGGFALMAQMGKAPVQPMAIVGARDITPKGTHFKRFGRVYCKMGECIDFASLGVKGRKQQASRMEEVAMGRVYQLRDELRAEHPGKM